MAKQESNLGIQEMSAHSDLSSSTQTQSEVQEASIETPYDLMMARLDSQEDPNNPGTVNFRGNPTDADRL